MWIFYVPEVEAPSRDRHTVLSGVNAALFLEGTCTLMGWTRWPGCELPRWVVPHRDGSRSGRSLYLFWKMLSFQGQNSLCSSGTWGISQVLTVVPGN